MKQDSAIYVAGHAGLVGAAIVRRLRADGYSRLLLRSHAELELEHRNAVDEFFETERPEYVFLAAAKVGGIFANLQYPADFIRSNLLVQSNVIDSAFTHGAAKLLFLGSSCIYPREAPQPIREESLLGGPLEPTNEAYAVAKIAGITMCQAYARQYGTNFISAMPTNTYGPGDHFHSERAHVLPALIRQFHDAKVTGAAAVTVRGTGVARREFLHVDDLASACVFLMEQYDDPDIINVGYGKDLTIAQLARLIADVVGFRGKIAFDHTMADGMPRKLLDSGKLHGLGWQPSVSLEDGVRATYEWFVTDAAHASKG